MHWSRLLLATAVALSPALLCAQTHEPAEAEARAAPSVASRTQATTSARCPMTLVMAALIASAERQDALQKQRAASVPAPAPAAPPSPHAATAPTRSDDVRGRIAVQADGDRP
ncbi:hypothetical protein [Lysobacter solisilvae (ex Woo and Kim 2020)]|uniref:Uncharacterized protein n=1 Tax=Agrilutibacter terrestris TaxID=2865112 RepID=A0A7H0G066_9GAMM|nr:hypothetical protein [Lysobacter terrestris]QNP41682.1 hypothetical protein H8B22_05605 [Lysobacter terrestris]